MKTILVLLTFVSFGIISCNINQTSPDDKKTPAPDAKTEIGRVNDLLKQYEEPSQTFKVSAAKPSQVTGKNGTIISINPADLIAVNGTPLGANIEVELKELMNQEQLLKTNAQTTSNGKLLVSGGAYYINMTSDGQPLKLKEGKNLSVQFPKITSKEMSLFYGQRDSLGQLNWQQSEQKFERVIQSRLEDEIETPAPVQASGQINEILGYIDHESKREFTPEEKRLIEEERRLIEVEEKKNLAVAEKVYKAVELKQFGWINCDRFYDATNVTDLKYVLNEKDSIVSANVYLVFKDINSIMQNSYFSFEGYSYNSGFQNIPVGSKTKLIAFSIKNGKIYSYKSDLTIKPNTTVQLTFKEINQDQVGQLFQ